LKTESGAKNNSQLPKGWEVKKLGEVCGFQNGFAFKSKVRHQISIFFCKYKHNAKKGFVVP
jgi:hypothetical protein